MDNATNSPRFSPLAQSSSLKNSGNRYLLCPLDKRLLEIFELSTEFPSVEACYSSVVNACISSDILKIKKMTAVVHDKNRSNLEKKSIYFSFLFEAEEQIKMIKSIFATIVTGKDSELNRDFFFNCPTSKWQNIEKVSVVIVDFCKIDCASIFNCLFYDTEENFEKF
ncbi:MAG: hypothetical protein H0T62_13610 [Parachlamydiaceae bacterium]|nr:hypothetical protein [Parachlamydiaceae bacterium]